MKSVIFALIPILILVPVNLSFAEAPIYFSFENDNEGWEIPDWAFYQEDHKGVSSEISSDEASVGNNSLKLMCDFPGDLWAAAVVEYYKDINLRGYKSISADVYLPKNARGNLYQARIIVTVGSGWGFIETREAVLLKRGKWTNITALLDVVGQDELKYWKCKTKEKCVVAHLDRVRKIALRIEYNAAPPTIKGQPYKGPVYLDNIVIE